MKSDTERYQRSAGLDLFNAISSMRPSVKRGGLAVHLAGYILTLEVLARKAEPRRFANLRRKILRMLSADV